ncbi:universal stress protein [Natronolimnohabitans innermongolicus]|uniref:UspA domain-containing protein n=1 Tax=Natronolimnohabitans innermongolicus JCM 12255 TaxID=1227499 RepID=L9X6X4_9EURY|nr:universal stress protein [Natronolimnohabitans innermongolicus]ELY57509.1 UspA domain-containing protein [Natronolimnohabitans innermongolicus JCM 12255]
MVRHVLVPIDDSDPSGDAIDHARAQYDDATITLVHVLEADHPYGPPRSDADIGGFEEYVREFYEDRGDNNGVLERALTLAADDPNVRTELRSGSPDRKIVDLAEESDVDLIVVGSHGRTGASRVLLGSVAEKIARRSPVPVTIVR